jgi:hypothetical protein
MQLGFTAALVDGRWALLEQIQLFDCLPFAGRRLGVVPATCIESCACKEKRFNTVLFEIRVEWQREL